MQNMCIICSTVNCSTTTASNIVSKWYQGAAACCSERQCLVVSVDLFAVAAEFQDWFTSTLHLRCMEDDMQSLSSLCCGSSSGMWSAALGRL